ncbi:hypothetical protein B0T26DRAFT_746951 [Lasiosphaeria miniovina]|uniref:Uncharacterized protein n=1 Tax=Lasiosphaeria miniovina TaxID=1954250 RepID=A0AA40BJ36_9PEZI|nr:uncharacterized protein B0T26DRAFT_746951 [Lasiosphaeria miniovina]KAK0735133.1 hypothetical protein B0T26DRAFT_746951 [Lasiosphaeria miniovina]
MEDTQGREKSADLESTSSDSLSWTSSSPSAEDGLMPYDADIDTTPSFTPASPSKSSSSESTKTVKPSREVPRDRSPVHGFGFLFNSQEPCDEPTIRGYAGGAHQAKQTLRTAAHETGTLRHSSKSISALATTSLKRAARTDSAFPARSSLQRIPALQPPLRAAPEPALFVDCRIPDFPDRRRLGFPHIIDTRYFGENTDPNSYRLCDGIATFLKKYNPALCERFFSVENRCIEIIIYDLRWLSGTLTKAWSILRQDNFVRVDHKQHHEMKTDSCSQELMRSGEWRSVEMRDNNDNVLQDDMAHSGEIGARLAKLLLVNRMYRRVPYFEFLINVDGKRVYPEWPGEDVGERRRLRIMGVRKKSQQFLTGTVRP